MRKIGVVRTVSRRELMKGAPAIAFVLAARARLRGPLIDRSIATTSIAEKAVQLSIYSDPACTAGAALKPGLTRESMQSLKMAIAARTIPGLYNGRHRASGARRHRRIVIAR